MLPRLKRRMQAGESLTLVAYGDSICEVGRTPGYFGGATSAEGNWAQQLQGLLRQSLAQNDIKVISFGVGGQNSYEGLGRLDYLPALNADLVMFEFGANDRGFHPLPPEASYLAMKSLAEGARLRYEMDVLILIPGFFNPLTSQHEHVLEIVAAIRQAAIDSQSMLVDIRSVMLQATDSGKYWADYHNGESDCHPNDRGHSLWAQTVAAALLNELIPVKE